MSTDSDKAHVNDIPVEGSAEIAARIEGGGTPEGEAEPLDGDPSRRDLGESSGEIVAGDLDLVPANLREKVAGKVEELAERLGEICKDGPQEIEGQRNFVQDLRGRWAGYRVTTSVVMRVTKVG